MERTPIPPSLRLKDTYPSPPSVHWALLLVAIAGTEGLVLRFVHPPFRELLLNLVIAAWPLYLCVWLRKIVPQSLSLYWALASLATGFLFSWLLWIVVIYEVREDLLEHYNRREPIGLRLNVLLTLFFSFVYFQFHLRRIALEKRQLSLEVALQPERSLID
jgi:hypothetical protein